MQCINLRDETPSKTFCFIIEYTMYYIPYVLLRAEDCCKIFVPYEKFFCRTRYRIYQRRKLHMLIRTTKLRTSKLHSNIGQQIRFALCTTNSALWVGGAISEFNQQNVTHYSWRLLKKTEAMQTAQNLMNLNHSLGVNWQGSKYLNGSIKYGIQINRIFNV